MLQKSLIALVGFFLPILSFTGANAMNDQEVASAYRGCQKFMAMSFEKKKEVAKRTGKSVSVGVAACAEVLKHSLKESQRLEREFQKALRARGRTSRGGVFGAGRASRASADDGPQFCTGSHACGAREACVNQQCVAISGATGACRDKSDCGSMRVCIRNRCEFAGGASDRCHHNGDCGDGFDRCVNNRCE